MPELFRRTAERRTQEKKAECILRVCQFAVILPPCTFSPGSAFVPLARVYVLSTLPAVLSSCTRRRRRRWRTGADSQSEEQKWSREASPLVIYR